VKRRRGIRVILVDDHAVVREGIRSILDRVEGIRVVGEASTGQEAMRLVGRVAADVVLMDIAMPRVSGLEAARKILASRRPVRIVFLTMHADEEYVREAVRLPSAGYVLKDASPDDLVRAIRAAAEGETFLSPRVSTALLRRGGPAAEISPREREVLREIAAGRTNKEIARLLKIAVRTVETHRERIMRKLDIHTVAGLTRYALSRGVAGAESFVGSRPDKGIP
jgi:DNA-binding NarL/FixJ family response regulator